MRSRPCAGVLAPRAARSRTHQQLEVEEEELVALARKAPHGVLVLVEERRAPANGRRRVDAEEGGRRARADVAEDGARVVEELGEERGLVDRLNGLVCRYVQVPELR